MQISIIVPAYNEEENIKLLYKKIKKVFVSYRYNYEVIVVDDGSEDDTLRILKEIKRNNKELRVISFRRNFGQTAAFAAGFDYAKGDFILTLDADLQNDTRDIPKLLERLKEGYDVVSGWRKIRKDNFWTKVLPSKIANWLISRISGVNLHDYGCSLKAYRKEILRDIKLYGEMHRFIPAIAASVGARIAEIEVSHHERKHGSSKYGLDRTMKVILDLLVVKFILSYQFRPIQLFGKIGFMITSLGSSIFVVLVLERFFGHQPLSSKPLFMISIFLILVGIQFVTIGLLAEIMVRIYYEARNRPPYYIKEII
ncbi:glycosyl transferase [Candidatus Woesebacteria bacterium RIFCSPHIGHO2_01_FULL_38_10]|uniref:Glycosyl transferase n=1 Tax=Candidatus Woesebacteria bacterium RIFCSPLOWO2_01_FULL_39_10b TaxID=1802517 RepID=A0A1F8B866_9BACT|nr:MAG: glycosyl transferase [Candidatus Woesebacteria bacterium RIFCSPHIGHO2_01_FULL_38_10]OGM60234.1 MAG: glycosyl transferase [Candidatus Woesebacteria bacterium RIFCSPLOWO2_01_FULL_39_10b]